MGRPLYQIIDWDKYFENAKSRSIDRLSWCAIPNKQDGLGYGVMMRQPNGAALYGAFVALVLVCSKHTKPRQGYLTDTGRIDGYPYDATELSVKTQVPVDVIEACLEFCVEKAHWIKVFINKNTAEIPEGYHEDTAGTGSIHIIEGRERKKGEKGGSSHAHAHEGMSLSETIDVLIEGHPDITEQMRMAFENILKDASAGVAIQAVNDLLTNYAGSCFDARNPPPARLKSYVARLINDDGKQQETESDRKLRERKERLRRERNEQK